MLHVPFTVVGERALCAPVGLVGSAVPIFCILPDVLTVPPVIEKDVKISITVFALSVSPSVLLTSLRASCCSVTRFAKLRHGCVFTRLLRRQEVVAVQCARRASNRAGFPRGSAAPRLAFHLLPQTVVITWEMRFS